MRTHAGPKRDPHLVLFSFRGGPAEAFAAAQLVLLASSMDDSIDSMDKPLHLKPGKPPSAVARRGPYQPHCTIHISCSYRVRLLIVLSLTFLLLFLLLFFLMLAGAHIKVAIGKPTVVDFRVVDTSTSTNNTTAAAPSTFLLNTDVVLSMDVKNPTPGWGTYYYEALQWNLLFGDASIASGVLPSFSQAGDGAGHNERRIQLQGVNVTVPAMLAFAVQSNETSLNMEAGTSFYVHLKGSYIKFGYVVHCNLTFPHTMEGFTRLQNMTSCLVADQDRGHY